LSDAKHDRRSATRGFASRAVHAGERAPLPAFRPTVTPIYPTVSFSYDELADMDAVFGNEQPGYVYTRYGNPTFVALETAVASLEGADAAIAFSSGMAALHTAILSCVQSGARIVAAREIYGATAALFNNVFATQGVKTTFVDALDLDEIGRAIEEQRPRVVFLETISNPILKVVDIGAIAALARKARATVIVDNTFASPMLVNPIRLGAQIVVHSSTKYLSGHGDVTGGVIATDADRANEIRELTKLTGSIPGPFEAWLTLRGIKTLPLRMRQQSENAAKVAAALAVHPAVSRVYYPGPGAVPPVFNNELRGGMIAFEIASALRPQPSATSIVSCYLRSCRPTGVYRRTSWPRSASARIWSGCRSASRTLTTSSPTLIRRSKLRAVRHLRCPPPAIDLFLSDYSMNFLRRSGVTNVSHLS
jgi:cystathionine beta-lyase/cystathionine gamma-synthase